MISKKVKKILSIIIGIGITAQTFLVTTDSSANKHIAFQQNNSKATTNNRLGEDYIEKLKRDGFSENEINQSILLVNRVMAQLNQIIQNSSENSQPPVTDNSGDNGLNKELSNYSNLMQNINLKEAITLTLKLKNLFGSMEDVLNEYLYCIQTGIDLNTCLKDKKQYDKQKKEKIGETNSKEIITVENIESKTMEYLQVYTKNSHQKTEINFGQRNVSDLPRSSQSIINYSNINEKPNNAIVSSDIEPNQNLNPVNDRNTSIQIRR